jgi:hypothetical protein
MPRSIPSGRQTLRAKTRGLLAVSCIAWLDRLGGYNGLLRRRKGSKSSGTVMILSRSALGAMRGSRSASAGTERVSQATSRSRDTRSGVWNEKQQVHAGKAARLDTHVRKRFSAASVLHASVIGGALRGSRSHNG